MSRDHDDHFGKSFGERHPIIGALLIIAYIAIAIPPAVIMFMR